MRRWLVLLLVGCSGPQARHGSDVLVEARDASPRRFEDAGPAVSMPGPGGNASAFKPRPAKPASPPADAPFEKGLRWTIQYNAYPPLSTAGCAEPRLTLIDGKARRYSVRCKNAEFTVSAARCNGSEWSSCLQVIERWRMLDSRLEAMRKLAARRGPGSLLGPNCPGPVTPEEENRALFNLGCTNGYKVVEVVCDGKDVSDSCKVFTRREKRLPYGHPPK